MIQHLFASAAAAAVALAIAGSASAATDIGGSINLAGSSANYFNPGNGFVPPGFGNSDGPLVTIGSWVEFGFAKAETMGTADFTASTLHLSMSGTPGAPGAHSTFKATTAGFWDNLVLVQTTLRGLSFKVDDNTLILDWEAGSVEMPATADFTFKGDGLGVPGGPDDGPPTGGPPDGGPPKVDPPSGPSGPSGPGPVPEPATWAMMVLGFGALGAVLRRRRQAMPAR